MTDGRRTVIRLTCGHCRARFLRVKAYLTYRRRRFGDVPVFCGLPCAHASRRTTKADKVSKKAAYDVAYRAKNLAKLKVRKAAYFQRTYDPVAASVERKKRMRWHVEYCRRYYADPRNKAAKVEYDAQRRSAKYGSFAGAHRVLVALKKTICKNVPDKYERAIARGYYQRSAQQRRRDAQISRH